MYTNHFETQEYPFSAVFYTIKIDYSKPLIEQVEEKVISMETVCDVDDKNSGLSNDVITIYIPYDFNEGDLTISLGETVEIVTYGVVQKGRVLGVYPSQLGGVKVVCKRI